MAENILRETDVKTTSECPLIGNGDSVTIKMKWRSRRENRQAQKGWNRDLIEKSSLA